MHPFGDNQWCAGFEPINAGRMAISAVSRASSRLVTSSEICTMGFIFARRFGSEDLVVNHQYIAGRTRQVDMIALFVRRIAPYNDS